MRTVILTSEPSFTNGTFGTIVDDQTSLSWHTIEPEVVAIPNGEYYVEWLNHPEHGWCYQVLNVPGHNGILIHHGNFMRDTKGCVILGKERGVINDVPAVLFSDIAIQEFNDLMNNLTFKLTVVRK